MLAADGFWSPFWPSVVATFIGVVAGLPAALWINRLTSRASLRLQERSRQQALSRAILPIRESLRWNAEKATQHAKFLEDKVAFWDTALEVARWEAVREEFIGNAHDPRLRSDVAFFFNNVRLNAARIPLLFDFALGASSTNADAAAVSDRMAEALLGSLREIAEEARALDERLGSLITTPEDSS